MPMRFRWKRNQPPVGTIDAVNLRPDRYATLTAGELGTLRLSIGRHTYPWAELFEIEGDPSQHWQLPGCVNYLGLGQAMSGGILDVVGPAGDYAGREMTGGTLRIAGDAGFGLGAALQGGLIEVQGNVGPQAGGPLPDSYQTMTDGEILIHGHAGPRLGQRMRRGLIACQSCDEQPGYHLQAGTIVIQQGPVHSPGLAARRGTLVFLDASTPSTWNENYLPDAVVRPVILHILLGRLQQLGWPITPAVRQGKYQLSTGDRLHRGQAEVFQYGGTGS